MKHEFENAIPLKVLPSLNNSFNLCPNSTSLIGQRFRSMSAPIVNSKVDEKILLKAQINELNQQMMAANQDLRLLENQNQELQNEVAKLRRRETMRSGKSCLIL